MMKINKIVKNGFLQSAELCYKKRFDLMYKLTKGR